MARLAERARKRAAPPAARGPRPRQRPRKQAVPARRETARGTACRQRAVPRRAVAMAQQLCLRGALRPVTRRGSVAVRACAALRRLAASACGWGQAARRSAAAAERCWRRSHCAALPASPLLRRLPISPPSLAGPGAGLRGPSRGADGGARLAGVTAPRRGAWRVGVASRLPAWRPCHTKPNPDVARAFCLPDAARRRLRPCRGPREVDHPRCSCGRRGDPQPEAVGDGADVRMRSEQRAALCAATDAAVRSYIYGIGPTTAKAILVETVRCHGAARVCVLLTLPWRARKSRTSALASCPRRS